ncbi:MAG TPA: MATE family efflux transporter [Chthoniobacterales bacterium]
MFNPTMQMEPRWSSELRATVSLAVPIACGQVGQMLMGLTDTVIVGRLGPVSLAAVAFANSLASTLLVCGIGVLTSISVVGAREHGAGNAGAMAPLLRAAVWVSLLLGLVLVGVLQALRPHLGSFHPPPEVLSASDGFLAVIGWSLLPLTGYFGAKLFCEALGHATAPMWFLFGGVLLNTALALGLVFGWWGLPALGLVGSAWATLISRWCTFGVTLAYAVRLAGGRLRTLVPSWRDGPLGCKLLWLGLPVGFQYFSEVAAFNFGAIMMGWIGTAALAAHQIAISCAATTFMVPLGISQAVSIRIGHALGAGSRRRARLIGLTGIGLSAAVMLGFAAILGVGRADIAGAFNADPDVLAPATTLLLIAGLFQLGDGIQVTAAGALRGLADTRVPMLFAYLFYWGLAIPVAYVAAFHFQLGAPGIWIGFAAGLSVAAGVLTWRFVRLTRPGSRLPPASFPSEWKVAPT